MSNDGLTLMGGALEVTLTNAGYKLGTLSPRFYIVTPDADWQPFTLPASTGNVEGPERFIFYNAGAVRFDVDTLLSVEPKQLVAVGADDAGNWVESWRRNRGEDMARVTKTITLGDLQAIGASISGKVDLPAVPAGGRPIAMTIRAIQAIALTSSAGPVTGMQAKLRSQLGGDDLTILVNGLHTATQSHAQRPVEVNDTGASSLPLASTNPEIYSVFFEVSGAGVNFANLTGPVGDVYEVELIYAT